MEKEAIWAALDDRYLNDKILKRPMAFLGALGKIGLENLVLSTLDELLLLTNDREKTRLSIELSEKQIVFLIDSTNELKLNNSKKTAASSHLFLSILNALSTQLGISLEIGRKRTIRIYKDGKLEKTAIVPSKRHTHRLELVFTPNVEIFGRQSFSYFVLLNRCQELAMLYSGLKIYLKETERQKNILFYQDGLTEYIYQKDNSLTRGEKPLVIHSFKDGIHIEAVISKNSLPCVHDNFVNGHSPIEGGTHLDGFIQGSIEAINQFLEDTNRLKYLTEENFSQRFDYVLSIELNRPRYLGTAKKKIRNPELYKLVKEATYEGVSLFLRRHPSWYLT